MREANLHEGGTAVVARSSLARESEISKRGMNEIARWTVPLGLMPHVEIAEVPPRRTEAATKRAKNGTPVVPTGMAKGLTENQTLLVQRENLDDEVHPVLVHPWTRTLRLVENGIDIQKITAISRDIPMTILV